jgi:hypothetical protein
VFSLFDTAPDRPADPADTFSYTLNLPQCLAARGQTFGVGEVRQIAFQGSSCRRIPSGGGITVQQATSSHNFVHR